MTRLQARQERAQCTDCWLPMAGPWQLAQYVCDVLGRLLPERMRSHDCLCDAWLRRKQSGSMPAGDLQRCDAFACRNLCCPFLLTAV
jgi:hypothetical protein